MNNIDEMIKVLQHFKDGGEVERKVSHCEGYCEEWGVIENPVWDFMNDEYRIKRKPRELVFCPASNVDAYNICNCENPCEGAMRVREVLDEN